MYAITRQVDMNAGLPVPDLSNANNQTRLNARISIQNPWINQYPKETTTERRTQGWW